MIELTLFMLAVCIYFCSSYISYSDAWRKSGWFIPVGVVIGLIASTCWFILVKYVNNNQRIYVYSLFWDAIICWSFYVVPLIFFNIKIDRWGFLGLAMMVAGLTIIKIRSG